eukprot:700011_1
MMQSQIRKPLLLLLGCFMFLATSRASTYIPYDDDGHIGCEEKWNELIRSSNLLDVQTQITKIRSDQDETTFQAEVSFPDSNIKLGNQGSKIYSHKTLDHEFKKLVMTCTETFMKHVFWEVPKYGEAISSEEILKILNSIERGQARESDSKYDDNSQSNGSSGNGVNSGGNSSDDDSGNLPNQNTSQGLVAQVMEYSDTLYRFETTSGWKASKASKPSQRLAEIEKQMSELLSQRMSLRQQLSASKPAQILQIDKRVSELRSERIRLRKQLSDTYLAKVSTLSDARVKSQRSLNVVLQSPHKNGILENEVFNKELRQMFVIRSDLLRYYSIARAGRFGLDVLKEVRDLHNLITSSVAGLIKHVYKEEGGKADRGFQEAVSYQIPELEQ